MRTRLILSVVAVLFAVAGALTTNAAKPKFFTKVAVTVPSAPNCNQSGFCDNAVSGACMVNATDQYRLRQISGEDVICTVLATGQWSQQ